MTVDGVAVDTFRVSSALLAAASPYFRSLLFGAMLETGQNVVEVGVDTTAGERSCLTRPDRIFADVT